tara:strand:+ start:2726 stop:3769 length:1044 start_codon:yes stop_codon:yes gene_type:complete
MSCKTCKTKTSNLNGCKNNGVCGTDGCNKLNVFNWLSNLKPISKNFYSDYFEVRFKNGRKDFYKNNNENSINIGDPVIVESSVGFDLGHVTLKGGLISVQMKKKKFNPKEILKIIRKANQDDIDLWIKNRNKEEEVMVKSRNIALTLGLKMKISDVEFQADGKKTIFYYTAKKRVDFRELILEFAHEFHTKVEMKQIGLREEAGRLGGIGSCGRELCCSTWLTDFRVVTTSAARYQQLSLNPQKIAGQCGKLKCCLNFELDQYQEALQDFPKSKTKLITDRGVAICQKLDIFKKTMWFSYKNDSIDWFEIKVKDVKKIIDINLKGNTIVNLKEYSIIRENIDEKAFI